MDISDFLKAGAISNLDWLEIDPAEYRKEEPLPKQNLDARPDLEALWAHEDRPSTAYLLPNVVPVPPFPSADPHTMGDMSEAHGALRARPSEIRKTARLALMQSTDLHRFRHALTSRYDMDSLRDARGVIAEALAERGLLGPFYIDASDFPTCNSGNSGASEFVKRFAQDATYVVAKSECTECVHAHKTTTGGNNCAVFHKEIRVQVPYTEALAAKVEALQSAHGKELTVTASEPKERIRLAMLAPERGPDRPAPMPKPKDAVARLLRPVEAHEPYRVPINLTPLKESAKVAVDAALRTGRVTVAWAQDAYRTIASASETAPIQQIQSEVGGVVAEAVQQEEAQLSQAQQIISASNLTRKRDAEARAGKTAQAARPVVDTLRREMLKGRSETELVHVLKHGFQVADLAATREHWEPMFREAGLYGVVYSTQDSFADCHEGADFLAKHNPQVKVVVAGQKCGGCIHNKIGRCLMYGKPLVASADDAFTQEMVAQTAQEYKTAGHFSYEWLNEPNCKEQLRSLHKSAAILKVQTDEVGQRRMTPPQVGAFYGTESRHNTTSLTRQDIAKTAARYMNEGLYGRDLLHALKSKYESRDLVAAKEGLRTILGEQGLMGIYYVDPSVYPDYGRGCDEAARLHRSRLVKYAKVGSKCSECVLQTKPGFCSKLHKPLVEEPPYGDKVATQRAVLASGASTEVPYEQIVNNGLSMMAEYDLQNKPMDVEVESPAVQGDPMSVILGNQGIKL